MAVDVATATKGGFWVRLVAYLIDAVILFVVQYVVGLIGIGQATQAGLSIIIGLAYFLYFWSASGGGQTPGMRVFGLRVVKTDGSSLDYVGAFLRYVGLIISFAVILIGVIWVAFDPNKQGWHDKIAGTYVIKA